MESLKEDRKGAHGLKATVKKKLGEKEQQGD